MTEEERAEKINRTAANQLQITLKQMEEGDITNDDFLGLLYGEMVAGILLGYNLEEMVKDAKQGADNLSRMAGGDNA